MTEIFGPVLDWYMGHINYFSIFFLMAIESSFIPFPSEIVIPPAAYLAAQGKLSLVGVIASGTAGALTGAFFNYYLALYLGRKVIYAAADSRYARWFLINRASVDKSEKFFIKYGNPSTLIGRLVPGVRQLISIPAGLVRMDIKPFVLYTTIGSGTWNIILAALGYFFYTNKELLEKNYHILTIVGAILGAAFVGYLIFKSIRKKSDR